MSAIWRETVAEWKKAHAKLVERFRQRYLDEVVYLTRTLRPLFQSGELRGWIDSPTCDLKSGPMEQLEDLCADYFGTGKGRRLDEDEHQADVLTAQLILAVSPSSSAVTTAGDRGQTLPQAATRAVTHDVLALAIARRWRKPERNEWTPGLETITRWAEVRS